MERLPVELACHRDEVVPVTGDGRLLEAALALAAPGGVEAAGKEARVGEVAREVPHRSDVARAGEAGRDEDEPARRARGLVKEPGEPLAARRAEREVPGSQAIWEAGPSAASRFSASRAMATKPRSRERAIAASRCARAASG